MNKQKIFESLISKAGSTKQKLFNSAVYLFSTKGYANVGIRELCHSVDIQASSFYNHFNSKEGLFDSILEYFAATTEQVVLTDDEVEAIVSTGDVRVFFIENMKKFSSYTANPLYYTVLQIVFMESYTNAKAYELGKNNLYYLRKGYTEKVLRMMIENGSIKDCNVEVVTAEYYYALKGMLDQYLMHEVWNEDTEEIMGRIYDHIDFFIALLQK